MKVDQSEIHRLSLSEDIEDRFEAVKQLEASFKSLPDKVSAWADLVRLAKLADDEEELMLARGAVHALFISFEHVPNKCKPRAWLDLVSITNPGYFLNVREDAADFLGYIFKYLPDEYKYTAWADLVRLIADNSYIAVTLSILSALNSVFKYIPEEYKSSCWADLQMLTVNKDPEIRESAVVSIGSLFMLIPNECKFQAWDDLHKLTNDECSNVRERAAESIGSVFSSVPEKFKLQALADLHQLTADENSRVRESVVGSIGSIFLFISDECKPHTWNDLHELTNDIDKYVRQKAVVVLDLLFSDIPDEFKSQAWYDLVRLAEDADSEVRMYANHSIGKIYIYKASIPKNEGNLRTLLEYAIQYFEKAAKERDCFNPARFCYPFYRSFDAVVFKKIQSKKEIQDYITSAKKEIEGSESKQKLMEMVELLAEALETAMDNQNVDVTEQELFKYCSDICNQADYLMGENKEKTPIFFGLYKNTMPYFRKEIKDLIDEVKEKAEIACREAKGTGAEHIACSVNKEIQGWKVEDQVQMGKSLDNVIFSLKMQVPNVPENMAIITKIDEIKTCTRVEDQMNILSMLIPLIPNISISRKIDTINGKMDKMQLTLEQIKQKLNQNYDQLHSLSLEVKSRRMDMESENIETFTAEIKELVDNRDSETLKLFVEKLSSCESLLIDKVKESKASYEEKAEGKKVIGKLRELPGEIKKKTSSFGKDVSKEVVVTVVAEQVIRYLIPVLTTAILGVPIPTEIINILLSVKNSDL